MHALEDVEIGEEQQVEEVEEVQELKQQVCVWGGIDSMPWCGVQLSVLLSAMLWPRACAGVWAC